MNKKPEHVVVIGAGIVGISTAIWLQRDGCKVTLLDRDGPAAGTSYGNAGVLASAAVVPVTTPGLVLKAPKMLLSRKEPLFLLWRYLPKLLPFLRRYLAHANAASVEKTSTALNQLLHDSPDQHVALAKGSDASKFITVGNYLFGYTNKAAFEKDKYSWDARKKLGIPFKEMTTDDLAEFDPALGNSFGYGVLCPNHGHISDPGEYVKALAGDFLASGGVFTKAALLDFSINDGLCGEIQTTNGPIKADAYVLATGAWSGGLAKKLGIKVLLESERGYHIEFVNPSIVLRAPVMVASGKFVATPMRGRLRCAGIVEFGGLDLPPSKSPIELLKRNMAELFPNMTYDRIEEWMGHRPATEDSIPVIGRAPHATNVLVGYGHHHVGLTGGPKTGRWLAGMLTGQRINADLAAYAPERETLKT